MNIPIRLKVVRMKLHVENVKVNTQLETVTQMQLVAFRGECSFRQYMSSNPARYGTKFGCSITQLRVTIETLKHIRVKKVEMDKKETKFGFHPTLYTEDAVRGLINFANHSQAKYQAAIFLDIEEAFGSLWCGDERRDSEVEKVQPDHPGGKTRAIRGRLTRGGPQADSGDGRSLAVLARWVRGRQGPQHHRREREQIRQADSKVPRLDNKRNIISANCKCKAGVTQQCKHISAAMHFVNSPDSAACETSQSQGWSKPSHHQLLGYDKGLE
ncbi:hypothetical protein WA026_019418 [Henosepilachna vigintioctopunctata]|uniref:SWIM-type domain-containing protein n=1 Tax=Henosepilachna vigintioctopunctata TaxID=420089 RepID=A0AAW1U9H4_9CUCU